MLANSKIHPTLPAVDLGRARKFYEEKLGLEVLRTDPSPGVMFQDKSGTAALYVYQRGATKADHTVAAFEVEDIEAEVKELKAKGVKFDVFDVPGVTWENEIAVMGSMKGAWFKDSEGNTLAVMYSG